MPSLCSVSQSEPLPAAKGIECGNDIVVLDTDAEMEMATKEECQPVNNEDSLPAKQTDEAVSSIENPLECPAKTKETKLASGSESLTPNSKKRRVSPNEDSGSKQKQQKKVNQMTLSSFFFQRKNNAPSATSSSSKTPSRKATSASKPTSPVPQADTSKSGKCPAKDPVVIDVDMDTEKSPTSDKSSEETKPSRKEVTEKKQEIQTVVETKTAAESDKPAKEEPSSSMETERAAESSPSKTVNVLSASVVKKKTRARAAKSKKPNSDEKENNGRKAKQSTPKAKKTKALDSLATTTGSKMEAAKKEPKREVKKELSEDELSEENRALLQKYRTMKERYLERVNDVMNEHKDGLSEEVFGTIQLESIADGTELKTNDANHCEEFPSEVVTNMALLIEGR